MIKDLLEQLAPLDAQIAALRGNAADEESDMSAITAHASELAELAVEEDEILRGCGPLTAEDRVFLARHPRPAPTSTRPSTPCLPISLSSAVTASAGKTGPFWAASPNSTGCP